MSIAYCFIAVSGYNSKTHAILQHSCSTLTALLQQEVLLLMMLLARHDNTTFPKAEAMKISLLP